MKRAVLWLLTIVLTAGVTVLACFPAPWLRTLVERQTDGRLTLGDAQGTLWRGSAFIGGAPGPDGAVTPLLPGRFAWSLSPLVLVGMVDVTLENPAALSQPVHARGSWSRLQLSPSALLLPAEGLAGLGAPLNTLAPSGTMRLSWSTLEIERAGRALTLNGRTTLEMKEMASRISSVKPLGSYALALDWKGSQADLDLATTAGPLLLSGKGALNQGRLRFSGQAQAAKGYEATLGNLLPLLGQRRIGGDKNIIALELN